MNGNLTRDEMITWFAQAHKGHLTQGRQPGPWMLGVYARGRTELLKLYLYR